MTCKKSVVYSIYIQYSKYAVLRVIVLFTSIAL